MHAPSACRCSIDTKKIYENESLGITMHYYFVVLTGTNHSLTSVYIASRSTQS